MKRLTPAQYAELSIAYQEAMDSDSTIPGKHWILIAILNTLGYHVRGFPEACAKAEELLDDYERSGQDRDSD
jgi:NAD-dependent DNA ligase